MDHDVRCRNGGTDRELTLKCKLKCYVKPMKDPLGVSLVKGLREPQQWENYKRIPAQEVD